MSNLFALFALYLMFLNIHIYIEILGLLGNWGYNWGITGPNIFYWLACFHAHLVGTLFVSPYDKGGGAIKKPQNARGSEEGVGKKYELGETVLRRDIF